MLHLSYELNIPSSSALSLYFGVTGKLFTAEYTYMSVAIPHIYTLEIHQLNVQKYTYVKHLKW